MITSDRDVFVGAHLTKQAKDLLRFEAKRRNISMSALISDIVDDWLVVACSEQVEPARSNKREEDVLLPFPEVRDERSVGETPASSDQVQHGTSGEE